MKALILAAGIGSRLAPITDSVPKSMVPVNGKPILVKQIENLMSNGVEDITIITGYKSNVIEELITKYPTVKTIESKDYLNTNNMYSAYLAKEKMYNQEMLLMNADVYYDESIIAELLKEQYVNAIVTDIGTYNEESMKVVEKNGRLIAISKKIEEKDALGCSIDVYKFCAAASIAFFDKCSEYIEEKKELKLWSEVALNDILNDIEFVACPLKGRWVEIDNHDDLAMAENIFSQEQILKR